MTTTDLTSISLRLDLLSMVVTAMAAVLPREKADDVAYAVRKRLELQLVDAALPEIADELLVADVVRLLEALAAGADIAAPAIKLALPLPMLDGRFKAGHRRMPARTFMGSVCRFRRPSSRRTCDHA